MREGDTIVERGPEGGTAPQISVVVPCYNSAWCIDDTLRTLRNQRGVTFEILVIDDGSTDDLAPVLAPHLADDPRLRVIRQENRGLAGARNRGLAEARGGLVAFIDADDIWHPDFLRLTSEALARRPHAPFAFAYSFRMDVNNRLLGWPMWRKPPRHDFKGMVVINLVGNGSAGLFRTDLARAAGGFDITMRDRGAQGAEDWKLCLKLAALGEPALIPRPLVGYRFVAGSMSQGNPARQMRAVQAVMADIAAEFPAITPRQLADAQVTMNGWLLPAFLAKGQYGSALKMLAQSYLGNPLWFTTPSLRALHRMTILNMAQMVWRRLRFRKPERKALRDIDFEGERPFADLPVHDRPVAA